jgi:hypothetical protein
VEDEVVYLRARLRAGALDSTRLLVADLCQHPAAGLLLDECRLPTAGNDELAQVLAVSPATVVNWRRSGCPEVVVATPPGERDQVGLHFHQVLRWKRARESSRPGVATDLVRACEHLLPGAGVRAALAAGRLVLPGWEAQHEVHPDRDRLRPALEALAQWAAEPSPKSRAAVRRHFERVTPRYPGDWVMRTIDYAAALAVDVDEDGHDPLLEAGRAASSAAYALAAQRPGDMQQAVDELLGRIAEALVPWALAMGPPG